MVLLEALVHQWKSLVLTLVKQTRNFASVYMIMVIYSYLFVNGKEIFKVKADNKNVNYPTQFCLWSISDGFGTTESSEVSLTHFSPVSHFYTP